MGNEFEMSTSDLILCANLLEADAQEFENEHVIYGSGLPLRYAKVRRNLKDKIIKEVERRDALNQHTTPTNRREE